MNTKSKRIEALLLSMGDDIGKDDLAQRLGIALDEVEKSIEEIRNSLEGHGISLVTTSTHVQLVTSPEVSEFLSAIANESETELSKAASETLAIIAYKGPISRYDVDIIRGVDSRRMIQLLLHRGIIEVVQTKKRARMYDITEKFLSHTGLEDKKNLPEFETLSNDDRIRQLLYEEHRS